MAKIIVIGKQTEKGHYALNVRLPREQHEACLEKANKHNVTLARVARALLDAWCAGKIQMEVVSE